MEIIRLFAGFTFPLLLFGHAVSSRLGMIFFDVEPTYASTIANLQAAGTQGMQLALLAPGWLHGCLGLWITLRRFDLMQRMKLLLIALVILIPVLAALGFLRMSADISAVAPPPLPAGPERLAQAHVLGAWKNNLTTGYLVAIVSVFILGRFRAAWLQRFQ